MMEMPPAYGIACDEIHILRDFEEDFRRGIFNFSNEEIERFQLDIMNLSDPSWRIWFRYRIENAGRLLQTGSSELLSRTSRYAIMCLFNLSKYWVCWVKLKRKYR